MDKIRMLSLGALCVLGCTPDVGEIERNLDVDALIDVNASSATAEQKIVPGDYEGTLSAWYFGHAN